MFENAEFYVSYAPDFPGENGPMHVFFANVELGNFNYQNELIAQHQAGGCLIDHQARLADIDIPDSFKLKMKQIYWATTTQSIVR